MAAEEQPTPAGVQDEVRHKRRHERPRLRMPTILTQAIDCHRRGDSDIAVEGGPRHRKHNIRWHVGRLTNGCVPGIDAGPTRHASDKRGTRSSRDCADQNLGTHDSTVPGPATPRPRHPPDCEWFVFRRPGTACRRVAEDRGTTASERLRRDGPMNPTAGTSASCRPPAPS